jgi:hypothetical protein
MESEVEDMDVNHIFKTIYATSLFRNVATPEIHLPLYENPWFPIEDSNFSVPET